METASQHAEGDMQGYTEFAPVFTSTGVIEEPPETERYARVNLKRTQKEGWGYETTVSIRTTDPTVDIAETLRTLHATARAEAVQEINIRTSQDEAVMTGSNA